MEPAIDKDKEKKAKRKRNAIIIGVTAATLCIGGYFFLWPLIKRKRSEKLANASGSPEVAPQTALPAPSYIPKVSNDNFPLKKGSRGPNVRALQQALIAKYGAKILPVYGADGDFGTETQNALISVGLPTVIGAAEFAAMNAATPAASSPSNIPAAASSDVKQLSDELRKAIINNNFPTALLLLKQIKSPQQYAAVSEIFKQTDIAFVKYTLVTAAFRFFPYKRAELIEVFKGMGLKHDAAADKWSLSGLGGNSLMTTQGTDVWVDRYTAIKVPAQMILGREIQRKGKYCAFENAGKTLLVLACHVRYC